MPLKVRDAQAWFAVVSLRHLSKPYRLDILIPSWGQNDSAENGKQKGAGDECGYKAGKD